ncbi:MAG: hypothetical protein PHY54_01625 [Methylococcales bacterium]|nr:hypothetical protein [Methylococcales bacterium]
MNDITSEEKDSEKLQTLKKLAAAVYICQALTFMLAGLPLLLGVAINFYKRNEVQGTWLESHFNWQIKTVWITLAGFAVSGLTLEMGIGFFTLIVTVVWLVYRIVLGWNALNDDKPINMAM